MNYKNTMLEDHLREPFAAWKANPTPERNATLLKVLAPTIEGAIRTHVGEPNPLLTSRARMMTLQAARTYNPSRGRLQSHVYNQLLGLKRISGQQQQIVHVPERLALARTHLDAATKELQATLGREPTDDELADFTGFNSGKLTRIRKAQSGLPEGSFDEAGSLPLTHPVRQNHLLWRKIVYDDLDDHHKKIMELAWGLNGRGRPLQNQEIAQRMNRSPGAISQAKARIQQALDEEHELSPFGG